MPCHTEKVDNGVEIRRFTGSYLAANMYVIPDGDHAFVVDPVENEEAFLYLKAFGDITVLLTHEHFDHIDGLNRLVREHPCTVIAQKKCSESIQDSRKNLSALARVMLEIVGEKTDREPEPFVCPEADLVFEDRYDFVWMGQKAELTATPGHSPGSACMLMDRCLFSGDSLLQRGPMNRFPGGSDKTYRKQTVPVLNGLLGKCDMVYPGHGEPFAPPEKLL